MMTHQWVPVNTHSAPVPERGRVCEWPNTEPNRYAQKPTWLLNTTWQRSSVQKHEHYAIFSSSVNPHAQSAPGSVEPRNPQHAESLQTVQASGTRQTSGTGDTNASGKSETRAWGKCRRRVAHTSSPILLSTHQPRMTVKCVILTDTTLELWKTGRSKVFSRAEADEKSVFDVSASKKWVNPLTLCKNTLNLSSRAQMPMRSPCSM